MSNKNNILKIDGSTGEGGGQIIRTALTLSMLTGTAIEINNIRANRTKSGLMRQHLVCVQASQEISNASVSGASLGSTTLNFSPSAVQQGDYYFDIGSAGSTSLVMQTILPALLFAEASAFVGTALTNASLPSQTKPSTVVIKGGTHNPLAPTTDFLTSAFIPALAKLGMTADIDLVQAGYAPVGGGEVKLTVYPFLRHASEPSFNLTQRDELVSIKLVASHLNLDSSICERELASAKKSLIKAGIDESLIKTSQEKLKGIGEGNSCYAVVTYSLKDSLENSFERNVESGTNNPNERSYIQVHNEVFSVLGEKRMSAERVGNRLAGLVKRYLYKTDALVDEYLADQLLLPLALSGGGTFTARMISGHTQTQAWLIEQFLPVSITFKEIAAANHEKVLVTVTS